MSTSTLGFVVVGSEVLYRAWTDPARCRHENSDICATCDHDRYYATTYPTVPWADNAPQAD